MALFTKSKQRVIRLIYVLGLSVSALHAQTLTVALQDEPTAIDPHYQSFTPNVQLAATLFDPLIRKNSQSVAVPALAQSWQVEGNIWTFHLRPNVQFSDGSPFTAADVVYSYERVFKIRNSPSSYALYLNQVKSVVAVDEHTVQIETDGPAPVLLANLAMIPILSQRLAQQEGPAELGQAPLDHRKTLAGTGPYQLDHWHKGTELVLTRNPYYWADEPPWSQVIFRPIPDGHKRVEALVTGVVDIIEAPPVADIARLEKMPSIFIQKMPSLRLLYVSLNQSPDLPEGIKNTNGANPLSDQRVRKALSLAIDREALVQTVMQGIAQAAGNLLSYPNFGTSERFALAPLPDLDQARELLKQAGYPGGFTLSLGAPVGRYRNDEHLAQAIAQMWAQIGVEVQVELFTPALFFKQRDQYAFSSYLSGWSAVTGEMSNPLIALTMTPDPALGQGITNWSHYSNPRLDELIRQAMRTLDEDQRAMVLEEAAAEVLTDYGILPILFELSTWAMKQSIRYDGRVDQFTLPQDVYPNH
ncbi:ABC transporter substrate-binding protein [Paenalcaligenes hominis]|uniref:ABC transporter substrate-binding protein n=1 Tax=Paenalcaligenes hominis TaxID=643674 RepID=UPI003523E008